MLACPPNKPPLNGGNTSGSPRLSKKKLSFSRRRVKSIPALKKCPRQKWERSLLIPSVSGEREAIETGVSGSAVGSTRSDPVRSYNEVLINGCGENGCSQERIAVCWRRCRCALR